MGLDDIDEDVPQRKPTGGARTELDDLFGDLGRAQSAVHATKGPAGSPSQPATSSPAQRAPSKTACDPLDTLFTAPPAQPSSAMETKADDLFDFSRPVDRKVHSDSKSLLDMFETQGKGRSVPKVVGTLGETRTPSTSKVAASLLGLMNYYDVLGVDTNASVDEIKRQYKKKAVELHPDKVGRAQSAEEAALFKVITKAHEVLVDDAARRAYDAELAKAVPGQDNWLHHLTA